MKPIAFSIIAGAVLLGCSVAVAACNCPFHSAMCQLSHGSHSQDAAPAKSSDAKAVPGGEGIKETPPAEKPLPFFGNTACPIMGGKVNPKLFVEYRDAKTHTYAKIYLCCPGCTAAVKKDPAAAYKKAYLERESKDKDGRVVAKKGEPLDLKNATCPVMGGKVAEGQFAVFNGYKVGFCCPGCEKTFLQSPEKFLAKLGARPTGMSEKAEGKPAATEPGAKQSTLAPAHH